MGKAVGILSLKGGVGKTSVVAALGETLAGFGKKVLLIDGNLTAPNLGLHFNIVDPEKTLHDLLDRSANIRQTIYKLDNFDVLPASLFNMKKVSPFLLKNRVKSLKKKYDIILIDSSPTLDEESLAVVFASDELLFVTTPDHPTLSTTLKSIKRAQQRGSRVNGIVLNKVYNKNFELSIDEIEGTVEVPILAVIPHDVAVMKALSNFQSSTSHKPKSKGSTEFKKLAAALIGEKYEEGRKIKDFFKITPKRQEINREIFYNRTFK